MTKVERNLPVLIPVLLDQNTMVKELKKDLFKDTIINKIFNTGLNEAVNHVKLAINKNFQWLKDNLFKICNSVKIKSVEELHKLLCNIHNNKFNLNERRTTTQAYKCVIISYL